MAQSKIQIADRYSKALFEVASEQDKLKSVFKEVSVINQSFKENPSFTAAFASAQLSKKDKTALVDSFKAKLSDLLQDFVSLVNDYNRMEYFELILEDFIARYNSSAGIVNATVTTTIKLDKKRTDDLKESLRQRFNLKEVNISNVIDESIMGGVIVSLNDQIIDGSVKQKLANIKRLLLEN